MGQRESRDGGGRPRVVIAGGGVAALEAVLALRAHAGDGVAIELLCPKAHFDYRPLSVLEPFDVTASANVDLAQFADEHDVILRRAGLAAVDAAAQRLQTDHGDALEYDALLIAIGCSQKESVPGALAFGGHPDVLALRGVLDHLDFQQARSLAFVAPDPSAWLVPLYELALLTRTFLDSRGRRDVEITFLTAEYDPLQMLGERSTEIAQMLLQRSRIKLRTEAEPVAIEERSIVLADGERIAADHIVAMPRMEGVPIPGVPQDPDGFIPIDDHASVTGLNGVYAAGDITAGFPKQGGLASRQADAAAEAILATLGFAVTARVFAPVIEGVLLTGEELADVGGQPADEDAAKARWQSPTKILSRFLAPYLQTREPASHFPAQWQDTHTTPGEIAIGGAVLEPSSSDRLAMRRLPMVQLPAGHDLERSRKFAREELGALAADDQHTRDLRESLRAYLAAGCSLETAAHDLGIEPTQLRAAITRSEELLGRNIADRLFELRSALEITAYQERGLQPSG